MKLKTLEKELNFIQTSEPCELMNYIASVAPFRAKSEKALVLRQCIEATRLYLNKYGLRSSARIALFRANHPDLVAEVLAQYASSEEVLNEFLTHGAYHTIKHYLHMTAAPLYPEQEVVEAGNEREILSLVKNHKTTAFARLELIMRGNPRIIDAIIIRGKLNEREKLAIMTHAPWQEAALLVDTERKDEQKKLLQQLLLIRFSSERKIAAVIARQRFGKLAEDFFFRHASFELLVKYIKHYNIPNGQEMLLQRGSKDKIRRYLSRNRLCSGGEKLLLDRGCHAEIKVYIKQFYFSEDNEVRFIKRGNHREIMLYITKHSLCDEAQKELIYRRNHAEIMYFVSTYPLANAAEDVLMKCGTPEQIRAYNENAPFVCS